LATKEVAFDEQDSKAIAEKIMSIVKEDVETYTEETSKEVSMIEASIRSLEGSPDAAAQISNLQSMVKSLQAETATLSYSLEGVDAKLRTELASRRIGEVTSEMESLQSEIAYLASAPSDRVTSLQFHLKSMGSFLDRATSIARKEVARRQPM